MSQWLKLNNSQLPFVKTRNIPREQKTTLSTNASVMTLKRNTTQIQHETFLRLNNS